MKSRKIFQEVLIISIMFVPSGFMLIFKRLIPDKLPIHWGLSGEPDKFGPWYVFPLMIWFLYFLLLIIPKIDPRKLNYTIFSGSYYKLRIVIITFFNLLFGLVLYNSVYSGIDFGKILPVAFLFLIAIIGNYLGTIRSNYFIGIRTPWTLQNDEVWKRTHVISGRIWFYTGFAGGVIAWVLPKNAVAYFSIGVLLMLVLIPVVMSFIYYRKLEKSRMV